VEVEHEDGDSVVPKWSSNKCVALRSRGAQDGQEDEELGHVRGSQQEQEHDRQEDTLSHPRSDQDGATVSVKEYPGVTHGGILWTPAVVKDFMHVMRGYYPREDEIVEEEAMASSREHSVAEDAHVVEAEQVYA